MFYPYRDAFWKGLSIYFDGLKSFLVDRLQSRAGVGAKQLIHDSLRGEGRKIYEDNLDQHGQDWKTSIDIVHFSPILHANWHEIFSLEFKRDEQIRGYVGKLAEARNIYAHDLSGDMNRAYVKNCLKLVGNVLLLISRRDLHSRLLQVQEQLGGSHVKEGKDFFKLAIDPVELNRLLGEWYWEKPRPNFHVSVDALWLAMEKGKRKQRAGLQHRQELLDCLAKGIAEEVFGRAEGFDPSTESYSQLTMGLDNPMAVFLPRLVSGNTLIVNADWAELHLNGQDSLFR